MKVGVVTGGGDCAGLNAVIEAVVKTGSKRGLEFVGIIRSFEGLLGDPDWIELKPEHVDDISATGGTIIQTTNRGRFAAKQGEGNDAKIPREILEEARANIDKLGLEALVVIGGDGTLSGAVQLQDLGVNLVAVPKTIDNDLCNTDQTFGFASAVEFVSSSLDRIHTTASSHSRVFVVETMGRHAGWIALYGGVAGNADVILIPEVPFSYEYLVQHLRELRERGQRDAIVVVAEGASAVGDSVSIQRAEATKEHLLGGISSKVIAEIEGRTEVDEFELRSQVLGHLQRGGAPTAEDRILALRYGRAAAEAIANGNFGKMVSLRGHNTGLVDINQACSELKLVTPEDSMYQTAVELGISFAAAQPKTD